MSSDILTHVLFFITKLEQKAPSYIVYKTPNEPDDEEEEEVIDQTIERSSCPIHGEQEITTTTTVSGKKSPEGKHGLEWIPLETSPPEEVSVTSHCPVHGVVEEEPVYGKLWTSRSGSSTAWNIPPPPASTFTKTRANRIAQLIRQNNESLNRSSTNITRSTISSENKKKRPRWFTRGKPSRS